MNSKIESAVEDVVSKKELKTIDKKIAEEEFLKILDKNKKAKKLFNSERTFEQIKRSSAYKDVLKKTRAVLREAYGMFELNVECVEENLEKIKTLKDIDLHKNILKCHASTRERLDIYEKLYKKVFENKINSVLDLGCGLNPFAYCFISKKVEYFAVDISDVLVALIKKYFKKMKIKGDAAKADLRKQVKLPKADICFMLKLLDTLEMKNAKKAAPFIKSVNSKYLLISFSTKTLSGKRMRVPNRRWIERLCDSLGYKYEILEFENEIFYLIAK